MLFVAGWKQHYSLYPASDDLVAAFKADLAPYKVSKGTIRFDLATIGHPGLRFEICYERVGTAWAAASSMLDRDGAQVLFSSAASTQGPICEVDLDAWAALPAGVHDLVESRVVCAQRRSLADF